MQGKQSTDNRSGSGLRSRAPLHQVPTEALDIQAGQPHQGAELKEAASNAPRAGALVQERAVGQELLPRERGAWDGCGGAVYQRAEVMRGIQCSPNSA